MADSNFTLNESAVAQHTPFPFWSIQNGYAGSILLFYPPNAAVTALNATMCMYTIYYLWRQVPASITIVPYFGLKGRSLILWVTLTCSVAMMPFGYVLNPSPFPLNPLTHLFLRYDQALSPTLAPFLSPSQHITASYNLASFFGALSVLYIGELLGWKRTILFATSVMLGGALLQVTSVEWVQMVVGRVILGVGNGIANATALVWVCESLCFMAVVDDDVGGICVWDFP